MQHHDVVVIGGSAGSLQPLRAIVQGLPDKLRAAVLVVMHARAGTRSVLVDILERAGTLPVTLAKHDEPLKQGRIYIAPPDVHLIVARQRLRVVHGPRENGFRPAVDPLFRTAARQFGPRLIGVILSGGLDDGTYGLSLIKRHGGVTIVQDPGEAEAASMPRSAMNSVDVDHVLPAAQIAALITRLSEGAAHGHTHSSPATVRSDADPEPQLPAEETEVARMDDRFGAPSSLTCPDCGGALWEIQQGRVMRYQCHVGHQYAPDALDAEQRNAVDGAMWSAVRVLEERAELKIRMARRAADMGLSRVSDGFAESARDAHAHAQRIRSMLFNDHDAVRESPAATRKERRAGGVKHPTRKKARGKNRE